ncbi:hypothetical protein BEWA_036190 [Theileria equi strain WA]|uniref:Uncharacterized protein n=1 Tax=Theileria equi strain WA TaxID=1537102 RepID=L1LEI1_THEEQ|nr:hypothetical protein BEWA_036190 [Theileria equi strain WA]EKX73583.1 hypothetical protein BEWA_036190 [Theileria equi strain WA]|eukprot:XP_004833035.1 hypothetical protein BEWA_036190 [Theileria equi strain WA]
MILPGDAREMERFIFMHHLPNCTVYVRIVTKAKFRGGNRRKIMEYMTRVNENKFYQIVRTPINVDILSQNSTNVIQVDDNFQYTAKRFRVRDEMTYRFTIGMVRYGTFLLSNKAQSLIDRRIIWEGGLERPFIKIISTLTYGERHIVSYKFVGPEAGFVIDSRKTTKIFLNPKDERFVDDYGQFPLSSGGEDQEDTERLESAASAFVDPESEEPSTSSFVLPDIMPPEAFSEQPTTSSANASQHWPCLPLESRRYTEPLRPAKKSSAGYVPPLEYSMDGDPAYCVGAINCRRYMRGRETVIATPQSSGCAAADEIDYDQRHSDGNVDSQHVS